MTQALLSHNNVTCSELYTSIVTASTHLKTYSCCSTAHFRFKQGSSTHNAPQTRLDQPRKFHEVSDFLKFRRDNFCCSSIYSVRTRWCSICPGDHEMAERRLRCRSPTCQQFASTSKCAFQWKVHHCETSSTWVVNETSKLHLRGSVACDVTPRPKVTSEMREFIQRKDESAVAPRLIWSNILRAPDIPFPILGFPTCAQVQRCVRYNRWVQGSRNSILRTQELVISKSFTADINPNTGFVFGNSNDDRGFPFVGNGEDDEPLILGITSMKLMQSVLALQMKEEFLIFHVDATFKLSDLSYPVITCGFTDRRRIYHLASIFIVSQRTESEYYEAVGSFERLFYERIGVRLRIDAVMGDADAAQLNGLVRIRGFGSSIFLMCFFHVLYNVRKRIHHLPESVRACVYRGILDLHYALSQDQLVSKWNRVLNEWQLDRRSVDFATYFYTQWMVSQFWRWQIYHSPGAYATTNNPCEVFNASIKRYTQRKACDTRRLIQKLLTIAEDTSICASPVDIGHRVLPPKEATRLAKVLLSSNRVTIFATDQPNVVRVKYLGDSINAIDATDDISNLAEDGHVNLTWTSEQLTDSEKTKAAKFYRSAVKWSVRGAHHIGMPRDGWVVGVNSYECTCNFFRKFLACAHVICGRAAYGLSVPGTNGYHLKFKDRRVRLSRQRREFGDNEPLNTVQRPQITLLGSLPLLTPPLRSIPFQRTVLETDDVPCTASIDEFATVSSFDSRSPAAPPQFGNSQSWRETEQLVPITWQSSENVGSSNLVQYLGQCTTEEPSEMSTSTNRPLPTAAIAFRQNRGRPPLASKALDIQYILR